MPMQSKLQCQDTPTTARALVMYCVVALFLFFEMAAQVAPSVMASHLMSAFNVSALMLGIMSGCYFYTYTLMQIPSGIILDRFRPRWVITFAILVCVSGNFLLAMAPNVYIACLARLLMGFGSAFAFVSVLVVTKDLFKPDHFAIITGITQALAALGAMSGQLPLSLLVQSIGWRQTLLALSLIGLVIGALVFVTINYSRCFCEQIKWSCDLKKPSRRQIFMNAQSWWIAAYAMLMWAPMSGFASLWGVPFLEKVNQLSANQAAFTVSLMWLGLAVFSPPLGYLSTRLGNRKFALTISALLGVGAFSLILFCRMNPTLLALFVFIAGAACAGQALSFSLVKERNDSSMVATAIAFNNMAVVISGAMIQPLIGAALDHTTHNLDRLNYEWALSPILGCYVIATIIALFFIKETFVKPSQNVIHS